MQKDIIQKLSTEIECGITKETQVVYILACVRKILEQLEEPKEFSRLKFYADWTLHSRLSGPPAHEVARILEFIYKCMTNGERAPDHSEAMRLIKFDLLKEELSAFLQKFGLRDFTQRTNAWVVFMYLYSRVVEDCPLVIPSYVQIDIEKIVIHLKTAEDLIDDHLPYQVNWQFESKGGLPPARYFIVNSYSVAKIGRL